MVNANGEGIPRSRTVMAQAEAGIAEVANEPPQCFREVRVIRAGCVPYHKMAAEMKKLQKARLNDEIPDTLIFVEHPEIVTVGPAARREKSSAAPIPSDYAYVNTDRGGGITYHGPGQLTVYPVFRWDLQGEANVKRITHLLEQWAINALAACGITAGRDDRMQGIWVDGNKIGSVGLAFMRWVSRHGFTINYDTERGRVESLYGCGLEKGLTTSLAALGYSTDTNGQQIDRARLEKELLMLIETTLARANMDGEGRQQPTVY
jgi:lipoate-protein ligase B